MKISVELPYERQTPGALVYAVKPVTSKVTAQIYVRKDKLREAGYTGPWPDKINVTLEFDE